MVSNRATPGLRAFFLSVVAVVIGRTTSQFILEPFDVFGAEGGNVTIYCRVGVLDVSGVDVYWGLPGDLGALGPNDNTNQEFPRHVFTGDRERGDYNLRIINTTKEDNGTYTCIYRQQTTSGPVSTSEARAVLNVSANGTPTEVRCSDHDSVLVFNDTDRLPEYTCTATGGVPLAGGGAVTWYMFLKDNSSVELPGIVTVDQTSNSVTSTIGDVVLSGEEDNSYLFCTIGPIEANLPSCRIPSASATEDRLRVRYKPLVTVIPSEIEVGMFETFRFDIKCQADSNPPLDGYPQFEFAGSIEGAVNGTQTGNNSFIETRLFTRTMLSVKQDDIGKFVNCTATNVLGTTTVGIEITSLGGLPTWLICAIILIAGLVVFLGLIVFFICCCKCDLEQEQKRTERRRRTMREDKTNGNPGNVYDDELGDIDIHTYDQAPVMMPPPDSPHDSGNYPDSDSVGSGLAMVNDFKIEEPEEGFHRVSIGSDEGGIQNMVYEEDEEDGFKPDYEDDEPEKKRREDYLQVTIADDTEGEDLQLDELSRDTSPSLNELIE